MHEGDFCSTHCTSCRLYLFLLVVGLLWALDVVICGGVFIVFGDIADMGGIGTLAAGAFIFALAIILGSVLLACAYRFTFRKMMMASGAGHGLACMPSLRCWLDCLLTGNGYC